ncbi:hypothetical protein B0H12DRAFT_1232953, partial [Mycena haematopus]
ATQTPDASVVDGPPPTHLSRQPSPSDAPESLRSEGGPLENPQSPRLNTQNDLPPAPDDSTPPPPPPPDDSTPPADLPPALVTAVKEKRGRHKKGAPKARPGKLPWVHGTKKVFFASRSEEWLRESDAHRTSAFYTKMAKLYVKKYGYNLADDQDLAVDVEDPPDSAADEVVHEILSPEEQASRAAYHKTLRTRIGQWYRAEYGNLFKSDKAAFKDLFTGVLDGVPGKPQRSRILHFYSRNFYETRIKSRVEQRVAGLKRRAELSGESVPTKPIDVVAKVTAEAWDEESFEFKQECEVRLEREYQAEVKAWEASLADSPTRTADEIAATLANAAFYLQPFVNAIRDRFGMCASVLLAGPIGTRGGRIGVQR